MCTHQFDVLSVHQDRGSDGTFVDVLCVDDSVFVVEFSRSHENVFFDVSPIFQLVLVSTFHSKIASHL